MIIQKNQSTRVVIDGREYLYFGGTNYLGLAQRQELIRAGTEAFEKYGFSSGAGRLTSGETDLLIQLESKLARFALREASVTLPAGYMSNSAVADALEDLVDAWIIQPHAHGSIRSAIANSRKPVVVLEDSGPPEGSLRQHCNLLDEGRVALFLEPINPLTGELTDPHLWLPLTNKRDFIIFDEAQSFGVLGETGAGVTEQFSLNQVDDSASLITTGTFSKALGSFGGFVTGPGEIINSIKERSNFFRASTPLSPVACAAALESLRLIQQDRVTTIDRLKKNIRTVNAALVQLGYDWFESNLVPIYHLPPSPKLETLQQMLLNNGIYLPWVSNYFPGKSNIGLRWTIQAGHTQDQLDRLLDEIAAAIKS